MQPIGSLCMSRKETSTKRSSRPSLRNSMSRRIDSNQSMCSCRPSARQSNESVSGVESASLTAHTEGMTLRDVAMGHHETSVGIHGVEAWIVVICDGVFSDHRVGGHLHCNNLSTRL